MGVGRLLLDQFCFRSKNAEKPCSRIIVSLFACVSGIEMVESVLPVPFRHLSSVLYPRPVHLFAFLQSISIRSRTEPKRDLSSNPCEDHVRIITSQWTTFLVWFWYIQYSTETNRPNSMSRHIKLLWSISWKNVVIFNHGFAFQLAKGRLETAVKLSHQPAYYSTWYKFDWLEFWIGFFNCWILCGVHLDIWACCGISKWTSPGFLLVH